MSLKHLPVLKPCVTHARPRSSGSRDPQNDVHLNIMARSAGQRAGRAGRTKPGRCFRRCRHGKAANLGSCFFLYASSSSCSVLHERISGLLSTMKAGCQWSCKNGRTDQLDPGLGSRLRFLSVYMLWPSRRLSGCRIFMLIAVKLHISVSALGFLPTLLGLRLAGVRSRIGEFSTIRGPN